MSIKKNYIEEIIDQIMKVGNLAALPEAEEMAFRRNLEAQFNRRLGIIIMQNLPDKGLDEYEKKQKDGTVTPEELEKILAKYVPDYEAKVKAGMEEFIKEVMLTLSK